MGLLDRVAGLLAGPSDEELAALFGPDGATDADAAPVTDDDGQGREDGGNRASADDRPGDPPCGGGAEGEPTATVGGSPAGEEDGDGGPAGPPGGDRADRASSEEAPAPATDGDDDAGPGGDGRGGGHGAGANDEGDGGDADRDGESTQAAAARALSADWPDRDLDLTPGSLARLDALVDERWRADRFRDAEVGGEGIDDGVFTELVGKLGCYLGEVLVRHLGGEWVARESGGPTVELPDVEGGTARAPVFDVAAASLVEPARFAESFDTLAERAGVDREPVAARGREAGGRARGSEGADEGRDGRGDPGTDAAPSDAVARLRAAAADLAGDWPDRDLDYGVASLARLDRLVAAELADEVAPAGTAADARAEGLSERPEAVLATAGYFGEVLRRAADAEWRDDDGPALVVEGPTGGARVDPVAVAADVHRGEDSFAATYGTVRGRLSEPGAPAAELQGAGGNAVESGTPEEDDGGGRGDRPDPVIDRLAAEAADAATADGHAGREADDGDPGVEEAAGDAGSGTDEEAAATGAVAERFAAAAAALSDEWPDHDLDGSVESLARLDALVAAEIAPDGGDSGAGSDAGHGDPLSLPAGASLSLPGDAPVERVGGYLAAVLRRHHDAEWRREDGAAVLVVRGPGGTVSFDPSTVAVARLAGATALVDAYAHVAARAGLEPPIGK